MTLDEAARRVQALADAARAVNPDILVLCSRRPHRGTGKMPSTR
jgi:hypothetical protein